MISIKIGVSLEKKAALTVTRLVDSGSGDSGPLVCDPTAKGRLGAQGGGAAPEKAELGLPGAESSGAGVWRHLHGTRDLQVALAKFGEA